jgi:hypothetical protein
LSRPSFVTSTFSVGDRVTINPARVRGRLGDYLNHVGTVEGVVCADLQVGADGIERAMLLQVRFNLDEPRDETVGLNRGAPRVGKKPTEDTRPTLVFFLASDAADVLEPLALQ